MRQKKCNQIENIKNTARRKMVELYTLSYYLMYTQFTHLLYVVFRNYVGLDGATITTHYKFFFYFYLNPS